MFLGGLRAAGRGRHARFFATVGWAAAQESGVLAAWRSADAVCFDVDSTVVCTEGIEVLADQVGVMDEITELTAKAMSNPDIDFTESLRLRLGIIRPSRYVQTNGAARFAVTHADTADAPALQDPPEG